MLLPWVGSYHNIFFEKSIISCLSCYLPTDQLLDGKTALALNDQTQRRIVKIRSSIDPDTGKEIKVEEKWFFFIAGIFFKF